MKPADCVNARDTQVAAFTMLRHAEGYVSNTDSALIPGGLLTVDVVAIVAQISFAETISFLILKYTDNLKLYSNNFILFKEVVTGFHKKVAIKACALHAS